jgi:hypothetical protein
VRADLGPEAVIETNQDLLSGLHCAKCDVNEPLYASLGRVTESQGRCPRCGEHRTPRMYHTIDGRNRDLLDRSLGSLGVPAWDIIAGRAGLRQRFYEFAGDRDVVLGPLTQ